MLSSCPSPAPRETELSIVCRASVVAPSLQPKQCVWLVKGLKLMTKVGGFLLMLSMVNLSWQAATADAWVMTWQGGSRRLLAPRELLRDKGGAQAPSASALSGLLGNSMGAAPGAQMYMVVGFEVMACSIARVAGQKPSDVSCIDTLEGRPPAPQEVTKGMARDGDASWPDPPPPLPCPCACSCAHTGPGAQAELDLSSSRVTADIGHTEIFRLMYDMNMLEGLQLSPAWVVSAGLLLLFGQRMGCLRVTHVWAQARSWCTHMMCTGS